MRTTQELSDFALPYSVYLGRRPFSGKSTFQAESRTAVAIDPNTAESHYNFGVLLLQQGKSREAEEPFPKALQADPRHAEAHNNLGDVLQRQGRLPEAVEEFQKALEARPDFPQAHFNLGRILVNQNEYANGIQELLKALSPEGSGDRTHLPLRRRRSLRAGRRPQERDALLVQRAREGLSGQPDEPAGKDRARFATAGCKEESSLKRMAYWAKIEISTP